MTNMVGKFLQPMADRLVIVPAERIARDICQLAITQYVEGIGGDRPVREAGRNDRQGSREQLLRGRAQRRVFGHIIHFAVPAQRQPAHQPRRRR